MTPLRLERHLLGDRPHESDELAGDGGDGDVGVFAVRDVTGTLAKAYLGLPRY